MGKEGGKEVRAIEEECRVRGYSVEGEDKVQPEEFYFG